MEIMEVPKEFFTEDFLENLHSTIFDFYKAGDDFRFDGGYVARQSDGSIFGYVLYKETSKTEIELTYGGVDRAYRGFKTLGIHARFINLLLSKYSLINTMVWNKNFKMLKLYMTLNFEVVGTKLSSNNELFVILNKRRES